MSITSPTLPTGPFSPQRKHPLLDRRELYACLRRKGRLRLVSPSNGNAHSSPDRFFAHLSSSASLSTSPQSASPCVPRCQRTGWIIFLRGYAFVQNRWSPSLRSFGRLSCYLLPYGLLACSAQMVLSCGGTASFGCGLSCRLRSSTMSLSSRLRELNSLPRKQTPRKFHLMSSWLADTDAPRRLWDDAGSEDRCFWRSLIYSPRFKACHPQRLNLTVASNFNNKQANQCNICEFMNDRLLRRWGF